MLLSIVREEPVFVLALAQTKREPHYSRKPRSRYWRNRL